MATFGTGPRPQTKLDKLPTEQQAKSKKQKAKTYAILASATVLDEKESVHRTSGMLKSCVTGGAHPAADVLRIAHRPWRT